MLGTSTNIERCIEVAGDNPGHAGRVLVEVKAPAIMDLLHTPSEENATRGMDFETLKEVEGTGFGHFCHFIKYKTTCNTFERLISKVITDYPIRTPRHDSLF